MPPKERRREPRIIIDIQATVMVLSPVEESMPARVADISGSGLTLITPKPIPVDSAVRIEGNDMLLLGVVCRCQRGAEESRVAVQVRHSLKGLMALERLNCALLGFDSRAAEPAPANKK